MAGMRAFTENQLATVATVSQEAQHLVGQYYAIAPREWARVRNEVRTLAELAPEEITDKALAQVLCYQVTRQYGEAIVDKGDLYRICLQDHRILQARQREGVDFAALLLYVVTHEFVHVVRFGVKLQEVNLPDEFRSVEEHNVDQITRRILQPIRSRAVQRVVQSFGC